MFQGRVSHEFSGVFSSKGFIHSYSSLLDTESATRIFIVKGGLEAGAAGFIQRIGEEIEALGYDILYLHQVLDHKNLDGFIIPGIKIAVINGSSYYAVEPKFVGVVEEVINLGDFLNEDGLRRMRNQIMEAKLEVEKSLARAARYIGAAIQLDEDSQAIYRQAFDFTRLNMAVNEISREIFGHMGPSEKLGKVRKHFGSSLTPDGVVCYCHSALNAEKFYVFKGKEEDIISTYLEKMKEYALERGFLVDAYYHPIFTDRLECMILPEMRMGLMKENERIKNPGSEYTYIQSDLFHDQNLTDDYRGTLEFNRQTYDLLLGRAVNHLNRVKAAYDQLKFHYVPYVDIEALDRCWQQTLAKIIEYAKEWNS